MGVRSCGRKSLWEGLNPVFWFQCLMTSTNHGHFFKKSTVPLAQELLVLFGGLFPEKSVLCHQQIYFRESCRETQSLNLPPRLSSTSNPHPKKDKRLWEKPQRKNSTSSLWKVISFTTAIFTCSLSIPPFLFPLWPSIPMCLGIFYILFIIIHLNVPQQPSPIDFRSDICFNN